jgi:hypothetical protein
LNERKLSRLQQASHATVMQRGAGLLCGAQKIIDIRSVRGDKAVS